MTISRHSGRGGFFDFDSDDAWYREKSHLHHTVLSNQFVNFWIVSIRQERMVNHILDTGDEWDIEARDKWSQTLERWPQVAEELRELATRIHSDCTPFRAGSRLLNEMPGPHPTSCLKAADEFLASVHEKWLSITLSTISTVDGHVTTIASMVEMSTSSSFSRNNATSRRVRDAIDSLASSGQALKDIFGGRAYVADHTDQ